MYLSCPKLTYISSCPFQTIEFQIALLTDFTRTWVLYLYEDCGCNWQLYSGRNLVPLNNVEVWVGHAVRDYSPNGMYRRGPNLFFKFFFSLLGLAYFTPLGRSLRFNFFWQFSWTIDPFAPKKEITAIEGT